MTTSYITKLLKYLIKTIAIALHSLSKNYIYVVKYGIAKGLKRKGGLGFVPQLIPLTQEEKFLMDLDLRGQTIYDIGGYEGIFTMFFARVVGNNGRVVTFEPNPENYKKIIENVKLNKFDNVEVLQIGLGRKREKVTLAFCRSKLGRGSAQEDIKAQILQRKGARTIDVEMDSLDSQIEVGNLPRPDFIKIDVEGLEMDVLIGMSQTIKKYKTKLFIEVHGVDVGEKIKNVQQVVKFLVASGYSIYHIESGQMIIFYNAQMAKEGHLYCS